MFEFNLEKERRYAGQAVLLQAHFGARTRLIAGQTEVGPSTQESDHEFINNK